MFRQLLRYLRPALRADFVAVELSDTFQTLSQRIEAMKNYRVWSRRQVALAGGMLMLLGAVGVVPWRVVAQEEQPAAKNKEPAAADQSVADKPVAKTAEQLIVGAWRAGNSGGKLTIHADGMYEEFSQNLTANPQLRPETDQKTFESAPVPGGSFGGEGARYRIDTPSPVVVGRWKIEGDEFVIAIELTKEIEARLEKPVAQRFKIVRLDDSFFRLTGLDIGRRETTFYRRVTNLQPLETIADKLTPEVLKLAQLLKLDSEEALALADWNKQSGVINKASWEIIERLDAAQQGKIDTSKLFQFTPDEAKAYEALAKVTAGEFLRAEVLDKEGLLTPEEMGAVKRMEKFREHFQQVYGAIAQAQSEIEMHGGTGMMGGLAGGGGMRPMAPRGGMGGEFGGGGMRGGIGTGRPGMPGAVPGAAIGPDGAPTAESQTSPRARQEALTKVNAYLFELATWLSHEVFKDD